MAANYKAELVGVFGQPVAENPTGVMQEAAFAAAGLNWRYLNIEVPPEKLGDAMQSMETFGMRGVNLTIPHKVAVLDYLDEVSPEAGMIGAVNTVRLENGKLIGENTDGKGFLRGITTDTGMDPASKRVVMIGAGGATRAIATELILAGVDDLLVLNRTVERGEKMVSDLQAATKGPIRFQKWVGTYAVPGNCDLFINATSIGLYPDINAMPDVDLSGAHPDSLVADVVFNPPETPLLAVARIKGLKTLDGLSMLVYQGMIGFEMWTGQSPDEAVMKSALQQALGLHD